LSFIVTWIIVYIIKSFYKARQKKTGFNILYGLETGGMPSSHSAVVAAVSMAVFIWQGISPLLIVSLVFSLIVISDAYSIRRIVGIHGEIINDFLKKAKKKPIEVVYGHTFFQVVIGILIGIIVSSLIYLIMF